MKYKLLGQVTNITHAPNTKGVLVYLKKKPTKVLGYNSPKPIKRYILYFKDLLDQGECYCNLNITSLYSGWVRGHTYRMLRNEEVNFLYSNDHQELLEDGSIGLLYTYTLK